MKKTILLVAALAFAASLIGCASKTTDESATATAGAAGPSTGIKDKTPSTDE